MSPEGAFVFAVSLKTEWGSQQDEIREHAESLFDIICLSKLFYLREDTLPEALV